jgi:hypothetical protein
MIIGSNFADLTGLAVSADACNKNSGRTEQTPGYALPPGP